MLGKINDTVINLQAENSKLYNESHINRANLAELNSLKIENQSLKNLIANLKHENEKLIKEHGIFIENLESKYIKEINAFKNEIQLQNDKYEFYNKFSVYVKNLENSNEELATTIQNLKETHKNELKAEYERNKIQCDEIKRKTLTFLSSVKKQANIVAYENLNNNTKLNLLQLKQFKIELESQSQMVENLLEKVHSQENQIKNLKLDLVTEKKIEGLIMNHNKKLTNMINNLVLELNTFRDISCQGQQYNNPKNSSKNRNMKSSSTSYDSNTIAYNSTGKSFYKYKCKYNYHEGEFVKNPSLFTLFRSSDSQQKSIHNSEKKNKKNKTILDAFDKQLQQENKISFLGSSLV
jgi:hypothetical protein